jgi:hypothetical protein
MKQGKITFLGLLGKSSITLNKKSWDLIVKQNGQEMVVGTIQNDNQGPML